LQANLPAVSRDGGLVEAGDTGPGFVAAHGFVRVRVVIPA
jgi:hypothetical protein